jgi:ketosteroid isomerase-like protein
VSRENVEIVRRIYEAVAAGDSEAVLANYDPGIELDFTGSPFGSMLTKRVYRGHEGLRRLIRERYEAFGQVGDQCRELIEAGDNVVSVVTTRGRGRKSGVAVEQTHCGLWALDAGKVTSVRWFGTRDEALEAAGPRE